MHLKEYGIEVVGVLNKPYFKCVVDALPGWVSEKIINEAVMEGYGNNIRPEHVTDAILEELIMELRLKKQ